ncbi:noelin-like [Dendronephthya gigantea]|uniref:noelin-like n=1 Tax=Dendronephthya gigantea TaxID=151771 RepID=UPI00106ACBEC|nr:noelin-like [Dendronephthya gigantea]XP_028411448.1 noelin-like [Dendronephthya gigantea]
MLPKLANNFQILFAYLILVCVKASASLDSSAVFKISTSGHRLTNHVVSERETSNVLECSLYCLRKPSVCKSFNYKARKREQNLKVCQLNNATKSMNPQNILPDNKYDYYEMLNKEDNKKQRIVSKTTRSYENCSKIKRVGEPVLHHQSGETYGTWMRDPLGLLGSEKIWYINSLGGVEMLEFENMDLFKAGSVAKTYNLTYQSGGTGSVVYGRYLYFNREGTPNIMKYDLFTEKVIREATPNKNINPRLYGYQWGGYTGMDLSIDESGLWALYALPAYNGRLCASQLDPSTLGVLKTFCNVSTEAITFMGNAFVACGVVYSIDKYDEAQTTINYAYNTTNKTATTLAIPFVNKFGYNSMVSYNPREKVLYSWDSGRQITYPLEFED